MSAIKVTNKKKEYILEFSRRTASMLERQGFKQDELLEKPNTMIPLLLQGAFLKNHPKIKPAVIDEIFDGVRNKEGFIAKLVELYVETVTSLIEENEEGNVEWVEI